MKITTPCGALLHNMCVPPKTVINHQPGEQRLYGRGLVFTLPDGEPWSLADLLARLDGCFLDLSAEEVEQKLKERLNEAAHGMPLPPAALVTSRRAPNDQDCVGLLNALTVLSKSSDHVYLRDKEPNLSALRPGRQVILLVN
jgi:hypothetical protein